MDQSLLNILLGSVSAVMGWFLRELWTAVKELKCDLARLREELPKDYVARGDYREDIREVKAMLQKLFERLDGKEDKHG